MSHIFISYSRRDLEFAQKIVIALAENDLDTWIDWKSIPKGEDWEQEIYRGIEEADAFLFLSSADSIMSEMCNKEIAHAVKNGKRILPIVIQDADKKNFLFDFAREEISKRNWIFCREGQDDFNKAIEEIWRTIHTDYEWLKYHTELQVKALKWEQKQDTSRLLRGKELREAEQQLAEVDTQKAPQPTKIQREYILASQRNEVRTRRQITTGITIGFIVVSVFCVAAVVASFIAVGQRNQAISKENARATAQANAEDQANIALARQLAVQAQLLFYKQDNSPLVATLLAIESKQRYPNSEADEVIRNSLNLLLPLSMQIPTPHGNEITNIAFSPDGKFIASGSSDNTARIWDANSGKEITLFRISGKVAHVRFSPDSKLLYIQSDDGYVRSWDITTGDQILEAYHGKGISVFDLSADGKIAASSGTDGIVLIWNTETGIEISGANHNNNTPVKFVAISPNGTKVASVGEDSHIKVWDSKNGRLISQKTTDSYFVWFTFSPDSQRIISNSGPNSELWDIETGELATKIDSNSVIKYLFSPDGQFIAILGVNAKGVEIWNAETGELVTNLPHEFFVFTMAFSPDGKYLASGSADGVIKFWNPATGKEVGRIIKSGTVDFAFSPNSDLIASPIDNKIYLWRTSNFASTSESRYKLPSNGDKIKTRIDPTGKWIVSWNQNGNTVSISDVSTNTVKGRVEHNSSLTVLNFSSHGSMLITGDKSGNACVWKLPSGEKTTCSFREGNTTFVTISPDLNFAAVVQNSGLVNEYHLTIWNIQKGEKVFEVTPGFLINNVTFSSNSELVAIAGMNSSVSIWDITSHKEIGQLQGYLPSLTVTDEDAMVFSSGDQWLITSGGEGARVWDLRKLGEISRITYDNDEFPNLETVLKTVISPDQTKLASVNTVTLRNLTLDAETKREATIRIWDPLTGKEIIRMVHNSWVNDIIWSLDGKYVLSGGWDGIVRIWDANNGNEVGTIVHDSPIIQLQFTPNGEQIISISDDGIYQVSYLRTGDIITQICSYVTRNLSSSEWIQYFGDTAYHATCPNLPVPAK